MSEKAAELLREAKSRDISPEEALERLDEFSEDFDIHPDWFRERSEYDPELMQPSDNQGRGNTSSSDSSAKLLEDRI